MEYGRVLGRAWHITWRFKVLWLFGFLVALFSSGNTGAGRGVEYSLDNGGATVPQWVVPLILLAALFAIVLAIVGVIVRYTGQAALIASAQQIEDTGNTSWHEGWSAGWKRFLHLFGIDLVLGFPFAIAAIILILLALSPLLLLVFQDRTFVPLAVIVSILLGMVVFAILIVAGMVVSVISNLAYRAAVLEQQGVLESLRTGWRLLRTRTGALAMWWVLLAAVGLGVAIVISPFVFAAGGLIAGAVAVSARASGSVAPAIVTALVLGLPLALIGAALRSVYETFHSVAWTLAYRELAPASPPAPAEM